ncbi:MAG TPA: hypothetical protein DCS54_03945, partial [Oribacterium sp.]|nr:hypothetical protein [Oribacterium sp.]
MHLADANPAVKGRKIEKFRPFRSINLKNSTVFQVYDDNLYFNYTRKQIICTVKMMKIVQNA